MPKQPLIQITFSVLLLSLTWAMFKTLSPFLIDIFIAIMICLQLWPINQKLTARLNSRSKAALLSVGISCVSLAIPLFILSYVVSGEMVHFFAAAKAKIPTIQHMLTTGTLPQALQHIPMAPKAIALAKDYQLDTKIYEQLPGVFNYISSLLGTAFSNIYLGIFHFTLILMILYSLFIQGDTTLNRVKTLIPLNGQDMDELLIEIKKVTDGTIKGAFLVGLIESTVGMLIFMIFQVPSVIFWGLMMFVAAIIPAGGSGLIYFPVGLYQLISGHTVSGVALLVLAMLVPNGIQTLIKPKIVGDKIGLDATVLLLTTLGGLIWMGLIGFIVGPLIAALFIAVWRQFERKINPN